MRNLTVQVTLLGVFIVIGFEISGKPLLKVFEYLVVLEA